MSILELKLLSVIDSNRAASLPVILAYRAGKTPSHAEQQSFMSIPAVMFMRQEYGDLQVVKALARVIEATLQRMGE